MLGIAKRDTTKNQPVGGLAGWLLAKLQGRARRQPRLEVIERISLAPRQTLALVEAEGRRFLVACSADSTPAFYPMGGRATRSASTRMARISW